MKLYGRLDDYSVVVAVSRLTLLCALLRFEPCAAGAFIRAQMRAAFFQQRVSCQQVARAQDLLNFALLLLGLFHRG